MRKVKCQYCQSLTNMNEAFFIVKQTNKTSTKKYYCNEQCYNTQQENMHYRKLIIRCVYTLLNIKFEDSGALINKKLKEMNCYTMKQIYEVLKDNELEIQMCIPNSGNVFGRISYLFQVLKSLTYNVYDNVNEVKQGEQNEYTNEQASQNVQEEVFVPMKKAVRKQDKKQVQELTIDF